MHGKPKRDQLRITCELPARRVFDTNNGTEVQSCVRKLHVAAPNMEMLAKPTAEVGEAFLSSRTLKMALASAIILYLGLIIGLVVTQEPYIDECNYSLPSWNLVTRGTFGMQLLEPVHYTMMPTWTRILPGIDKHWFAFMPLPMAVQVPWYKIFGYTIFSVRFYSFAWTIVALTACFFLARQLTHDRAIAILSVALIAIDQIFIRRGTFGRMDMMSAGLGFAGLSFYVNLRES